LWASLSLFFGFGKILCGFLGSLLLLDQLLLFALKNLLGTF
jgi:hypothetical protein